MHHLMPWLLKYGMSHKRLELGVNWATYPQARVIASILNTVPQYRVNLVYWSPLYNTINLLHTNQKFILEVWTYLLGMLCVFDRKKLRESERCSYKVLARCGCSVPQPFVSQGPASRTYHCPTRKLLCIRLPCSIILSHKSPARQLTQNQSLCLTEVILTHSWRVLKAIIVFVAADWRRWFKFTAEFHLLKSMESGFESGSFPFWFEFL